MLFLVPSHSLPKKKRNQIPSTRLLIFTRLEEPVVLRAAGRAELGSSLFLELPDAPSPLSLRSQQCQRCESIISASARSAAPTLAPGRRRGLTAALSGVTALLGSAEDVAVCPSLGGRLRTRGGTDAQTDGRTDGRTDRRTARPSWRSELQGVPLAVGMP
ncbi:uncharacterized protein GJ701_010869 isoform 1-T2 [Geothlypis trichas]